MNYFRCGGGRSTHTATKIDVAKTPLATFQSNVSGLYLPEILAYFSATQSGSGDPSPSNPRPISGVTQIDTTRTGVNLWGGEVIANSIKTAIPTATEDTTNKTVTFGAGSATNKVIQTFKVKENTQYTFIIVGSNNLNYNAVNLRVYYTDGTYSRIVFPSNVANTKYTAVLTTTANKTISYLQGENAAGNTTLYYDESGMFEGVLTADDFVAYTGTTATTNLGGTYYGGYVNVTTGLLTVTHGYVDLGSLSWTYRSGNSVFTAYKSEIKLSGDAKGSQAICSFYRNTYGDTWTGWANFPDKNISSGCNYMANVANIVVKDTDYTEENDFKTAVTGQTLVYELATPQTVQLTPAQIVQLLGQNNVFCSSGDVAVKYWKID